MGSKRGKREQGKREETAERRRTIPSVKERGVAPIGTAILPKTCLRPAQERDRGRTRKRRKGEKLRKGRSTVLRRGERCRLRGNLTFSIMS